MVTSAATRIRPSKNQNRGLNQSPFSSLYPPTAQVFTEQSSFRSFEHSRNVLDGAKLLIQPGFRS
jgi:hypothetical protein